MEAIIRLPRLLIVVLWLVFVGQVGYVSAQPSGYFKYKAAFDESEEGSPEKLDLLLKMIDVVFHYDLDMALGHAHECVQLARESGNSDAEAAGLMDLAIWTAYKFGSQKAEPYLKQAEAKFSSDGDPRFVAHYFSSRFGYSMVNEDEEYDPNRYLNEVLDAANEVGDSHLMMTYLYMAATSKVFVGKLPPTDASIMEIRDQLKEITNANKYETGKINLLFLDAQEKRLANDSLGALMAFIKAAEYCKEKQYLLFEVRAKLVLGYIELKMGYDSFKETKGPQETWNDDDQAELAELLQPVKERFEDCLQIATKVKMSSYTFESLTQLAYVELLCGNLSQAKEYVEQADGLEYECFRSWSWRDALYRHAILIYTTEGDLKNAQKYALRLASEEHRQKFLETSEKSTRYQQQLALAEEAKEQQENASIEIQRELVSDIDAEKGRADRAESTLFITLIGLCLVGLLSALAWNRTKLSITEDALSEEKETSRISQEMNDSLQERVGRLQRMESLGMLAGGVAHDFNNLLVGVMCNAELLGMRGSDDEFSNSRVQAILTSAEKAADLSRQMLAYAGKQQIQKRHVDIAKLTIQMNRILSATAGDNRILRLEPSNQILTTEVDPTQIEQILMNLVSNSRAASSDGSAITVRCNQESLTDADLGSDFYGVRTSGGDFVTIEVEDQGSGFTDEEKGRIFEPFFSTKDTGRGLGLAVVYGIVNGHDGLIKVESDFGQSTRFRIYLPKTNGPAISTGSGAFELKPVVDSKRKGNILVVDDEEAVRNMANALLELHGWNVLLACDGLEAINQITEHHETIDCVLLDVVMPTMGAQEVLEQLKEKEINLPIVVMSGYSESQLDQYRQNQQIISIVPKPFKTADLIREIEKAIA